MQRAVTAIYRTADVAELVRRDLEQLGIAGHNITILPDTNNAGLSTSGDQGYGDDAMERLHDLGLPDEDARTYQQALRNGDYVVSVEVDDDNNLSSVQDIMRRPEDSYNIDELDTQYSDAEFIPRQQAAYADTGSMGQAGGVTGAGLGATGAGLGQMGGVSEGAAFDQGTQYNEDGTVKVVEERLAVGKRQEEMGRVRVRSYVREVPVDAEVDLRATRVYVERRPVDRAVNPGDVAMADQVLEARETAEVPVVAKEARVVEEIGLRQETEVQHQHIQDTVRKTEVEIEDERTGERSSLTGGTTSGTGGTGGSSGTF